ncbi:hypothetical protein C5167_047500, partial [Papaver somniferum]
MEVMKMPRESLIRTCRWKIGTGCATKCFPVKVSRSALQQVQKQDKLFRSTIVEYLSHMWSTGRSEVVSISDEARIKWDRMNERMQQGSEAGATPPTEAELCAQVLKKKQRRCRFATTVSNNEGIREMLQAHADRIQAQEEQIRAQNEVIKKIKEDSEKVIRNMQV